MYVWSSLVKNDSASAGSLPGAICCEPELDQVRNIVRVERKPDGRDAIPD